MTLVQKSFLIILISVLIISLLPLSASAETLPTLNIIDDKDALREGEIFTLTAELLGFVNDYQNISSFEVEILFDPNVLEPQSSKVELGDIFSNWEKNQYVVVKDNLNEGKLHFAASIYKGTEPFTGNGILFSAPFKVLTSGTIEITVNKSLFVQSDNPGVNVVHAVNNLSLSVQPAETSSPEPPSPNPDPDPNPTPEPNPTPPPSPKPTPSPNPGPSEPPSDGGVVIPEPIEIVYPTKKKIEDYNDFEEIAKIDWAVAAIARLTMLGVFNGDENNNFRPFDKMTREEFATVIMRVLQLETVTTTEITYDDVKRGSWSDEAIKAVVANKLMNGKRVGNRLIFAPKDLITRAEIATILVRALNLQVSDYPSPFSDTSGHWARREIDIAYHNGLIKGRSKDRFAPDEEATRAEVAVMLVRLLDFKPNVR
ncbi:hypothetical protein BHF71_02880 [Vulcanibacillus modesticaldus]|uniref:SLH domain-containing protein n=1 Tax=Vulcanibacillus modesticaldus TaxID=337097 RepID=A0A1D2YT69_9BACI|nr:S-layer homology domain-containing protein [Vulcanibacillus modesticaldus]OEF98888.1 hypothetical protein BHF71_02880 [Vulcanibacillus modesticaldus]